MSKALDETLKILSDAKEGGESMLVAFSGGKDSLAVADLAVRTFKHCEFFFMFFIPGLESVEEELERARRRWGIKIRQYPHWSTARLLRGGIFCNAWYERDDLFDWKLRDVYDLATAETKIRRIMTGAKRADSRWRKWNLAQTSGYDDVLYPIVGWSKLDVLAYLKTRGIPLPDSSGCSATGIDLSTPSLLWLNERHPADFRRLCEVFPFAEAVVWRQRFYG